VAPGFTAVSHRARNLTHGDGFDRPFEYLLRIAGLSNRRRRAVRARRRGIARRVRCIACVVTSDRWTAVAIALPAAHPSQGTQDST
jgi:hypothetical protein